MNTLQFDTQLNKLLNPQLLSDEELRKTLTNLCIQVPVDCLRGELIEIFERVAMPLPQRNKRSKHEYMDYVEGAETSNVINLTSNIENVSLKDVPTTLKRSHIFNQDHDAQTKRTKVQNYMKY